MPLRHYRSLLGTMRHSRLLRLQAMVLFVTTYIDWVIMPYVTKLEGTYLPVYMISLYMLIGAADGFVLPLFRQVKIYRIYFFVIILDTVQILSYLLVNADRVLFTYAILTIFTIQAITFEISRVHTTDFMKDEIAIKEYLMLRSFIVSSGIILGALSAMLLDYFDIALETTLLMLALLGVVAIMIEIRLFIKLKNIVQQYGTLIKRNRALLNEKITI